MLKVDVTFTPDELRRTSLEGRTAVVIDVLRATTSITTALENGAAGIWPAEEVEDAHRLAQSWPQGVPPQPRSEGAASRQEKPLLAGERGARPPAGFDLGNSPLAFTPEVVGGRPVVLTTTNGTRTLINGADATEIVVACLRNAAAAAAACVEAGRDVIVACAGTEGRVSLEDVACAARLLQEFEMLTSEMEPGDGARFVKGWFDSIGGPSLTAEGWADLIGGTVHGRRLLELGFADDVKFCAVLNASTTVPVSEGGWLVARAPKP